MLLVLLRAVFHCYFYVKHLGLCIGGAGIGAFFVGLFRPRFAMCQELSFQVYAFHKCYCLSSTCNAPPSIYSTLFSAAKDVYSASRIQFCLCLFPYTLRFSSIKQMGRWVQAEFLMSILFWDIYKRGIFKL